ncbi:hypothetical protein BN1708_015020 [Verticillium longisporum]|uniref:Uncharacterized protein n=1 Tax=Verticillium longisporum TaxID=100787 RepID=A0A0G4M109_VERLO|nr:hypothetical protein BN1708_015020 [Verticillium longisporum]
MLPYFSKDLYENAFTRTRSAVFTTASAVPSWNLFQLSAVPTRTPGADALKLFILAASSGPVKFLRYNVSEPTVTA